MPIQINGTGTITGISAGGYPDGTVTAADLASSVKLGKVLNSAVGYLTGNVNITSSTFVDTGLEASITPSSTSNKILVTICFAPYIGGTGANRFYGQVVRGSTQIWYTEALAFRESSGQYKSVAPAIQILDSPNTTSAVTYKFQALQNSGTDEIGISRTSDVNFPSITLLEIAP